MHSINAEPYIGAGDTVSPEDLVLRPGTGGDTVINGMRFSDLITLVQSQGRMISELRSELASVTTLQQQQANDSSLAALATGLASITARVDAIQGPTVFKWSGCKHISHRTGHSEPAPLTRRPRRC